MMTPRSSDAASNRSTAAARWIYLTHFGISFLIAWLLRNYGRPLVSKTFWAASTCGASTACLAKQAVLRISLGCFVLHTCLTIALLCAWRNTNAQFRLHSGLWLLKALAAIVGLLAPFALPSVIVQAYGELARVLSGMFLLVQLILLLDTILSLNETLIDRRRCIPLLLFLTVLSLAFYVAGVTAAFLLFAPHTRCGLHIGFIVSNIAMSVVMLLLSMQPFRLPTAGLLTGALVVLYGVFLLLGGLSSAPPSSCNGGTAASSTALQVVGFFMVFAALLWATAGSSVRVGSASEDLSYRPSLFHGMYMLSSCYMGMLLLSWNLNDNTAGTWEVDRGYLSTWVKIVSMWVCFVLYAWVLIAPRLLPGREFASVV